MHEGCLGVRFPCLCLSVCIYVISSHIYLVVISLEKTPVRWQVVQSVSLFLYELLYFSVRVDV